MANHTSGITYLTFAEVTIEQLIKDLGIQDELPPGARATAIHLEVRQTAPGEPSQVLKGKVEWYRNG